MMKYLADEMLGKLCKWLRFLGYDTEYFSGGTDAELLLKGRLEERMILTRDSRLFNDVKNKGNAVCFIKFDGLKEQLLQIKNEFNIKDLSGRFRRCSVCNKLLEEADREFVKKLVPPYILQTKDEFRYCSNCRKVYWKGSHSKHINEIIEEVFNE